MGRLKASQRSDEVGVLVGGVAVHGAGHDHGVAAEDAGGVAVETGEAGDDGAAVVAAHLEEVAVVDDEFDERAGVVAARALGGNDAEQFLRAAEGVVTGFDAGGDALHVAGQVGEEAADLLEEVVFVVGFVVDFAAGVDVHPVAAQVLLADLLADRALHDGRAGGEELGLFFDHAVEVGDAAGGAGQAGAGAHEAGRDGDVAHELRQAPPEVAPGAGRCGRIPRPPWSCGRRLRSGRRRGCRRSGRGAGCTARGLCGRHGGCRRRS